MNKIFIYFLVIIFIGGFYCVSQREKVPLKIDVSNKVQLQHGAQLFMNYCSGCHALRYMRYNQMAHDLGLTTFDGHIDQNLLINNLIFTQARIADPIQISMPVADARQWFGKAPPDLSLSARQRGATWLYTYLKSYYLDDTRPYRANNLLVPNVAMPNVLAPLQGIVVRRQAQHAKNELLDETLVLVKKGEISAQEFDLALQDLVTFLVYVGEPAQLIRYRLGIGVTIFLIIFASMAYQLKRIYWKKVKSAS